MHLRGEAAIFGVAKEGNDAGVCVFFFWGGGWFGVMLSGAWTSVCIFGLVLTRNPWLNTGILLVKHRCFFLPEEILINLFT